VTYTVELDVEVTIEVVDAVRGAAATRETPPEPDAVELRIWLAGVDLAPLLKGDVLDALEADALERLRRAADEP
jgi:hypothetical protein